MECVHDWKAISACHNKRLRTDGIGYVCYNCGSVGFVQVENPLEMIETKFPMQHIQQPRELIQADGQHY